MFPASSGPPWPLQNLLVARAACKISLLSPTKTAPICITPASYLPFDVYMPKVAPKWPQSGSKVTFICQKWPQNNTKSTLNSLLGFIKWLKSIWENECFSKLDHSDSKVTCDPKVSKSDPRMTPKCPKVPRLTRLLFFLASLWPSWPFKILHKAIWYALQVPFDVYMPFWGSIFHFPAIVFHFFP